VAVHIAVMLMCLVSSWFWPVFIELFNSEHKIRVVDK
jgi:hypothetical protein